MRCFLQRQDEGRAQDPVIRSRLDASTQARPVYSVNQTTRTPAIEILPSSGRDKPAIESNTVVLPAPEAPNRMVNPGPALNATSKLKSVRCLRIWRRSPRS